MRLISIVLLALTTFLAGGCAPRSEPAPLPDDPGLGSTLAPEGCADLLHQDRPGGSDYHGPPVPGC